MINLQVLKNNISIIRDDLYPHYFGGNKARKMVEIEKDINNNNCNAVVTTGGIQSNHCRVTAIMSASNGWKCKLIYHGSSERFYSEKGNAFLVRLTGVDVEFVNPDQISEKMDQAMNDFLRSGFRPYYINGGGHCISGGKAYIDAVEELKEYNYIPDYIVLASGTGSTQAGIMAGLDKFGFTKTKVIGISIARSGDNGSVVIKDFYRTLCENFQTGESMREVILLDEWLYGGYEKSNPGLESFVFLTVKETGLFFDTTYTGKAFMALSDLIAQKDISGKILFWHTGGLLNLLK